VTLARIDKVVGRAVHVPGEDTDTDRIVPGRFLKCVTFDGLGEKVFYDARFAPDGSSLGHPLDDPRFAGATVLLADRNFGCGSSREHAPQSIAKRGFRAIVAESFAEIFFGNATAIGLACAAMDRRRLDDLAARTFANPETVVTVDLVAKIVRAGDGFEAPISMPEAARRALIDGRWDPIGELLEAREEARNLGSSLPYARWATG
jgi:3-isopropylmalate/(R)-2-methylmalate dehydratase small subunit